MPYLWFKVAQAISNSKFGINNEIKDIVKALVNNHGFDADDIVSEIYGNFLARNIFSRYDGKSSRGTFITKCVRNRLIDMLRKEKVRNKGRVYLDDRVMNNIVSPTTGNPAKTYEVKETCRKIEDTVTTYEVDILKGHTTYEEEADRLGILSKILRQRLDRKIKAIREKLVK